LKNLKHKRNIHRKTMNKLQRWLYPATMTKLEMLCEENGILFTKVNPAYTSQTCSRCGHVDRGNRSSEQFLCLHCGYSLDADYNAAINISRMGVYSLHGPRSNGL
jgi:transposase